MDINLRKANAIQQEIRNALNEHQPKEKVFISEFEDVSAVLEKAHATHLACVKRSKELISALYTIRRKTASANMSNGINDALNRIAEIDDLMRMLKPIASSQALKMEIAILNGKLEKIRSRPVERAGVYGQAPSEVETGILGEEDIEANKEVFDTLKREKRDLQDKLLELNVASSITLPEDIVTCLKSEGIL